MNIVSLHKRTPVWQRTPEWFMDRYVEVYRESRGYRWGRLLGIPDTAERHPDAPPPGEPVIGKPTHLPRKHRTLNWKDIASVFGSHVEWLILSFHSHREHIIDIPSWLDFADAVSRARRDPTVARRDEFNAQLGSRRYEVDLRGLVRCRNRTYPAPGEPQDEQPVSLYLPNHCRCMYRANVYPDRKPRPA